MNEGQRAETAIALANAYMKRFSELEAIEWRINYLIWGALGAMGYLWIEHGISLANAIGLVLLILGSTIVCSGHAVALYWLHTQQDQVRALGIECQKKAALIAGVELSYPPHRPVRGWRVRDWRWVIWQVSVTASLCLSVGALIRK